VTASKDSDSVYDAFKDTHRNSKVSFGNHFVTIPHRHRLQIGSTLAESRWRTKSRCRKAKHTAELGLASTRARALYSDLAASTHLNFLHITRGQPTFNPFPMPSSPLTLTPNLTLIVPACQILASSVWET
jgi:hypothetical protein